MNDYPRMQWGDIEKDVSRAEEALSEALDSPNEWGQLLTLRSLAYSQLALAKVRLREET